MVFLYFRSKCYPFVKVSMWVNFKSMWHRHLPFYINNVYKLFKLILIQAFSSSFVLCHSNIKLLVHLFIYFNKLFVTFLIIFNAFVLNFNIVKKIVPCMIIHGTIFFSRSTNVLSNQLKVMKAHVDILGGAFDM